MKFVGRNRLVVVGKKTKAKHPFLKDLCDSMLVLFLLLCLLLII